MGYFRVCRVFRVSRVYRIFRVYGVYRVFRVCKVYRDCGFRGLTGLWRLYTQLNIKISPHARHPKP